MSQQTCNGDATTLSIPQSFSDLTGTATAAQLPTGVPKQAAVVSLITQAANIGVTTVFAVVTSGFYRITAQIIRTQIATTSSTLPSLTLAWTDGNNSAAGSSTLFATNATNTLVQVTPLQAIMYAKAGTNITYTTAGYVSSGASPMQYALNIKCEQL